MCSHRSYRAPGLSGRLEPSRVPLVVRFGWAAAFYEFGLSAGLPSGLTSSTHLVATAFGREILDCRALGMYSPVACCLMVCDGATSTIVGNHLAGVYRIVSSELVGQGSLGRRRPQQGNSNKAIAVEATPIGRVAKRCEPPETHHTNSMVRVEGLLAPHRLGCCAASVGRTQTPSPQFAQPPMYKSYLGVVGWLSRRRLSFWLVLFGIGGRAQVGDTRARRELPCVAG